MSPRHVSRVVFAVLLALAILPAGAASKRELRGEAVWTSPELATLPVTSIALLPVATYDGNLQARAFTERALGTALRGSGHRWIGGSLSKDLLDRAGGDSLVRATNRMLLDRGRVDSLTAAAICRAVRARAVLGVIVDQWEQVTLAPNQSGRPSTSVQLRAALVDSTGALLWTANGAETLEGLRKEAGETVIGVRASTLNTQPITNTGDVPTYPETLAKIMARWASLFPRKASPDSASARR